MPGEALALLATILIFALAGRRLERWNISVAMVGLVAGIGVFAWLGGSALDTELVHGIAELTLVVMLFHDAATVRLRQLIADRGVPLRLLAIGFPLALVLTAATGLWLLPALGLAGAILVAGAVTPTDAGLGAPTVLNPVVPTRVRRALNVESGLNDGLATPVVLLALSALVTAEGQEEPTVFQVSVVPVILALVIALGSGFAGARALDWSARHRLSSDRGRRLAILVLPLFTMALAQLVGANVFIAAFVAGLVFGAVCTTADEHPEATELLEVAADLLSVVVWFLAGGLVVLLFGVSDITVQWRWLVYAVLILTVLRIVPVAVSLLDASFRWRTALFIGWFGPRGLATIVFGLLALEELGPDHPVAVDAIGVMMGVVVLSVFAHGITAGPLARRYGQWARVHDPAADAQTPLRSRRTSVH